MLLGRRCCTKREKFGGSEENSDRDGYIIAVSNTYKNM